MIATHLPAGRGFSVHLQGIELPDSVDRSNIEARIQAREFDLVVFGRGHGQEQLLFEEVCAAYPRSRVAMVYGNDAPISWKVISRFANCTQHIFSREMQLEFI